MADYFIGITCERINELEQLQRVSKNSIFDTMAEALDSYLEFISKCQSPIEKMLGAEIYRALTIARCPNIEIRNILNVYPQREIVCGSDTYRVDFCFEYLLPTPYKLVVECDGHEFHEKTKEQAAKDKKRDRQLIQNGYNIVHFTGSEIYKSPPKCVNEIWELFLKQKELQKKG